MLGRVAMLGACPLFADGESEHGRAELLGLGLGLGLGWLSLGWLELECVLVFLASSKRQHRRAQLPN